MLATLPNSSWGSPRRTTSWSPIRVPAALVCVQNLFHLADRSDTPVLAECARLGIAYLPFCPFCPLGLPRQGEPVLNDRTVVTTARRLGVSPAQVALRWLLLVAPNMLLIPGTASLAHLRDNLAAEDAVLDEQAVLELDAVGATGRGAVGA
jgi:pyridoxine 4-dehydrogenase